MSALAAAWPRIIIASGIAEELASWWCRAGASAIADRRLPVPHLPFDEAMRTTLFEARRARRVVRGFEAIEQELASAEKGMRRAPATRAAGARRISRLLVLSQDAAPRLYRNALSLRDRHRERLEIVVVECDEWALGRAVYGEGQRVRALLLNHKEVVTDFLVEVAVEHAGVALDQGVFASPEEGTE